MSEKDIDITIASYDSSALQYEEKVKNLRHYKEIEHFMSFVPSGGIVLDLGCGPGHDVAIMSEIGKINEKDVTVVGIDLSIEMIKIARKKSVDAGLGNSFFKMDIRNLSKFEDEFFDGTRECAAYLHIPKKDLPNTLNENYRVMKKGGIGYLCVKSGGRSGMVTDKRFNPPIKKYFTDFKKNEIEKFVKDAGFKDLDLRVIEPGQHDYVGSLTEFRLFFRK